MSAQDFSKADPLVLLRDELRQFAAARDWQQFHTPKNLAISISIEAAELLEHFQWVSDSSELTTEKLAQIQAELADVFIYLIRLADGLNVDLCAAAQEKLRLNATKYPVDRARGSSKKYTEL